MFEFFIARRILYGTAADGSRRASPPAIRLATWGIAIGLAVMLLSVAVVVGFKREIVERITRLDAHLQIVALSANRTLEAPPIAVDSTLTMRVMAVEGVAAVRPFGTRLCELKTDSDFLAIGIMAYDDVPDGITVSKDMARRLQLAVGDDVQVFFVGVEAAGSDNLTLGGGRTSVKSRRLNVAGMYETHFSDYDRRMAMAPLSLLVDVGGWDDDMATGLQVFVDDMDRIDEVADDLIMALDGTADRCGTLLYVVSARDLHPQVFAWLDLLDTNVWVILLLIGVVATFTMTSGLLIIILERTSTIGVLKALGADNNRLRRIFVSVALMLALRGLVWGNVIGLGLCAVQRWWHPLHLDPQNYYLEWVPIGLEWWHVVALNVGTIALTFVVLVVPSALVARISPTQAIRTE